MVNLYHSVLYISYDQHYHIYKISFVRPLVTDIFLLPGNGLNIEAFSLTELVILLLLSSLLFSLTIVESIPENLTYAKDAPLHTSTYQAWMTLLAAATQTVDIASYYWTLRPSSNVSDETAKEVLF